MLQRRVVVSGGGTGIGLATARGFAAAADRVLLDELGRRGELGWSRCAIDSVGVRATGVPAGWDAATGQAWSASRVPHESQTVSLSDTSRRHLGQWNAGGPAGGTVGGGLVGHAQRRWTIWLILISP